MKNWTPCVHVKIDGSEHRIHVRDSDDPKYRNANHLSGNWVTLSLGETSDVYVGISRAIRMSESLVLGGSERTNNLDLV